MTNYEPSSYDSFAWFYQRYWAAPHHHWHTPAIERLLLEGLPPDAAILDLCCGTGQLSQYLAGRGYKVTGIDLSAEMLFYARENVPAVHFSQQDATSFALSEGVDAAVCTFDSLNHILEPENMARAFRCVHAALNRGGRFVFDINTPGAYGIFWDQIAAEAATDHAFFLRGGYDPDTRIGSTKITMFRLFENWQRADVEMRQRPWEVEEVRALLTAAGFVGVKSYRSHEDLGMQGHYGEGRVYITCESGS